MAIVVLDDDVSIHEVWRDRFASFLDAIKVIDVSAPDDFCKVVTDLSAKGERALFLVDYELLGFEKSGLDLIESLRIEGSSLLVTSRNEDREMIRRCADIGLRILPKALAATIPILMNTEGHGCLAAVLIDNDELVRETWRLCAESKGKWVRTFRSPAEFFQAYSEIDRLVPIYVDYFLEDGATGSEVSKEILKMGFRDIYLSTGADPSSIEPLPWIRGIVGKSLPF